MRILVAISGARIEDTLQQVLARVGRSREDEWLLLHVTDTRPLEQAAGIGHGLLGRGARATTALDRMRETASLGASQELDAAADWMAARGLIGRRLARTGRPEREIIAAAADERADLLALGAGLGRDPGPGRYPLSPLARFVVDHALCDVLLLRPPDHATTDWLPPPRRRPNA